MATYIRNKLTRTILLLRICLIKRVAFLKLSMTPIIFKLRRLSRNNNFKLFKATTV